MSYRCRRCGRCFADNVALIQHAENSRCGAAGAAAMHRGVAAWEGSRGQQVFTSDRGDFSQLVGSEEAYDAYREEYVCCICDRGWGRLAQLNQHLASGTHDGSDNYRCRTCDQTFSRLAQILQHQRNGGCGATQARLGRLIAQDYANAGTLMLEDDHDSGVGYEATLYFDGGARPNPGTGGAGFVLEDCDDYYIDQSSIAIINPATVTNNVAEYVALIYGLRAAANNGVRRLHVKGDSELVIRQMRGTYRVNNPGLVPLYNKARVATKKFQLIGFTHVYRNDNTKADELATDAIYYDADVDCDLTYL
mmetsp:Transcript_13375/g.43584  ORF Transcript_13375/g.43584 Transcript_13375/m.43584 type:complete len:307 (+) Transcript_13375:59-979(+)